MLNDVDGAAAAGEGRGKERPGAAAEDIKPPGFGAFFWMFTLRMRRRRAFRHRRVEGHGATSSGRARPRHKR